MPGPPPPEDAPRRERWVSLLQHASQPIFVLFRTRRVRFVNPAWEKLTTIAAADAWGRACVRAGRIEPIFRVLAPPPEAVAGRVARVRRPVPPHTNGPPWWDVTFVPLGSPAGNGFLGVIEPVGTPTGEPPRRVPAALAQIRETHAALFGPDLFAGTSVEAARLLGQIRTASATHLPVWIHGEPGSGKETLARVIHQLGGGRDSPFAVLDATAVQPYLIEAAVFGHGGLLADGRTGTLCLKEPSALPLELQDRFAERLQVMPTKPRLVCVSRRPPMDAVRAGNLRTVFLTDYAGFELRCPPLRERLDDLPRILGHWAERLPAVAPDVIPVLACHTWPGNFHELFDVLADAARRGPITADALPRWLRERFLLASNPLPSPPKPIVLDDVLREVEIRLVSHALATAGGNPTVAATLLGLTRARLTRRIEALGLDPTKHPPAGGQ